MEWQLIIDNLYRTLLFTALVLLIIILFNNLVFYKRKLKDKLSLMLISSVLMCLFEILTDYVDGNINLKALNYIFASGYAIAFVIFGTILDWFFLEQYGLMPKKRWLNILLYAVPNIIFFLICVTTPWTKLLYYVDEYGRIQEMVLFNYLFTPLLFVHLAVALVPSFYYGFYKKFKDKEIRHTARSLIVYGALVPLFYLLEIIINIGSNGDYYALSLACAIALMYLTTTINTRMLISTQEKIEAQASDLRIASKIQIDALPPYNPEFKNHPNIDLYATMKTAREVGGDFYDYFEIGDDKICIIIADVSGKGTPAALFMMTTKTMIKDYALTHDSTQEIFTFVNKRLCENNEENMFATAWIGILDTNSLILKYSNAGHNYPLFKKYNQATNQIKINHGLFLGGFEETRYKQSEIQLEKGDRLLLYTDGVVEAHSDFGSLFGVEKLSQILDESSNATGETLLNKILEEVDVFSADVPQFDDITMMVLTIKK
ncbi:SpoIIE family protein phosphatase [bacterium]|nr:SpoIIE family protein phosphatase [bacterium]